jgi:hypothetical protein
VLNRLPKIIRAEVVERIAADQNWRRATVGWRWADDDVALADSGAENGVLPERLLAGFCGRKRCAGEAMAGPTASLGEAASWARE